MTNLTILFSFLTIVFIVVGLFNYLATYSKSYYDGVDNEVLSREFYIKRDQRIVLSVKAVILFSVITYLTTLI